MRLLTCLLIATLAAPLAAQQSAKRPITFADLMAMKRVSDPQISPSGKWVLFSVTDVSLEKNTKTNHLWIVPLDASAKEKQLTFGDGESNGRFAPDGKWVSYTADDHGKSQIFTATWNEGDGTIGSGRPLTELSTEADGAIWSPDSKSILFTSNVYSVCSGVTLDDSCNKQLIDEDAKSPVKALVFDHLLYRHWNQYQAPQARLAPPGAQPQGLMQTFARLSHILMLHVDNPSVVFDLTPPFDWGNDVIAPTFSLGGPLGYAWSPDSKEIAFVVNADRSPAESTNNDIYVIDATLHDDSKRILKYGQIQGWSPKKVSTSPGSDDGPQYSPDGKWLAWRSQARNGYESDKFNLLILNRTNGQMRNLTAKFDQWVDEFLWAGDAKGLYFTAPEAGAEQIFEYSIIDGTLSARTEGVRGDESADADFARDLDHSQGAEFASLATNVDGSRLVASMMSARAPAEIAMLDAVDREEYDDTTTHIPRRAFDGTPASVRNVIYRLHRLTHINDRLLGELDLPRMESFWFAGANNTKVQGFLIKPPNFDPSQKYPVKFLIHGGPQGAWGDAWSYRWNPELFAANGYVVVMINPRGSTGYGQRFLEEVSGDWGGRPYIDLMKGLDFAEAKYPFIDKNRECALGASYGGYMADWVLTHTNRFKCIVTHDGMSDPTAAFGDTEELWFMEWEFRTVAPATKPGAPPSTRSGRVGSSDASAGDAVVEQNHPSHPWDFYGKPDSQNPYIKWSPMRFIKDAHTPTLIVHSQRDMRLDVSQGLELFTALQLRGVPSKMLYFPDEGHWVLKPQNSQLWNETVNDWCDRWLGMNKYASTGPQNKDTQNPAAAKP